jgi:hypothetical protein
MDKDSGSETEGPSLSDNEDSPFVNTQRSTFEVYSKVESQSTNAVPCEKHSNFLSSQVAFTEVHAEAASQIDAMLPPPPLQNTTALFGDNLPRQYRPTIAQQTSKPPLKPRPLSPSASQEGIKWEAIKALKKHPKTEISVWSLMSNLDTNDLKVLCKFANIRSSSKFTKIDFAQAVFDGFKKGVFKSLFKPSTSSSLGKRTRDDRPSLSAAQSQRASTPAVAAAGHKTHPGAALQDVLKSSAAAAAAAPTGSTPLLSAASRSVQAPVAFIAVSDASQWKEVDPGRFYCMLL